MDYGVTLPTFGPLASAEAVAAVAARAESLGFHSLWATDHVAYPLESASAYPYTAAGQVRWDVTEARLDCLVALTWAAALTRRVRLGTSVLVLPMRPTLLVAKAAATLDHMSGGRLLLGVGAGWLEEEFVLLGQSFADRGARMSEAIRLLRASWGVEVTEAPWRHHAQMPFAMGPPPAQGARLPILIGGHSDAALRRVAEMGDGWHPTELTADAYAERLSKLRVHVELAGRSLDDLLLTVRPRRPGKPRLEVAEAYAQAGASLLVADLDYRDLTSLPSCLEALEDLASAYGVSGAGV